MAGRPKSVPTPAQVAAKALTALDTIEKCRVALAKVSADALAALADLPAEPLPMLSPEINRQIADASTFAAGFRATERIADGLAAE